MRSRALVFLLIVLVATFGAGIVDVLDTDVVPLRPYTSVFLTNAISSNIGSQISNNLSIPNLFVITVIALMIISFVFHIPLVGVVLMPTRRPTVRSGTSAMADFNKAIAIEDRKRRKWKRKPTKVDKFEVRVYGKTSVPLETTT